MSTGDNGEHDEGPSGPRHPDFEALHADERRRALLEELQAVDLPADGILDLGAGDLLFTEEGLLLVTPEHGDERTAWAPYAVGLRDTAVGEPTRVTVKALRAAHGHLLRAGQLPGLRARHPWLLAYERALLALELKGVYGELTAARQHVEDFYVPDTAALMPGPYFMNDGDMVVMVMESLDRGWVSRQLPPGVVTPPGVGNRFLVVLAHFGEVRCEHALATGVEFDYQETTVFLPCLARGQPGAYTPILFPDSLMAITLGREVYGFPKRFGKTGLDLERRYAELEVDERLAFWCEWGEPQEVGAEKFADRLVEVLLGDTELADRIGDFAGLWYERLFGSDAHGTFPPVSAFVRHVVPDVALPGEKRIVHAQDRLVRVPFGVGDVKSFHLLPDPRFEVIRASFLPPCRPLLGVSFNLDMSFGVQQCVMDYVGLLDHARLASRQARRTVRRVHDVGRGLKGLLKKR